MSLRMTMGSALGAKCGIPHSGLVYFAVEFLMLYRVKGAIIAGILLVSIISWPRGTPVTCFPYTDLGNDAFDFFKKVVTFSPIKRTLGVLDFDISGYGGQFGLAFIS